MKVRESIMLESQKRLAESERIIIITGANSGIGYEACKIMAKSGARIVMACRNMGKAETAYKNIIGSYPDARLEIMELNLASQSSIKNFVREYRSKYSKLDILINNAGVMATPYKITEDGFELQFGTNHLGHFALTGLLMDLLLKTADSRVVNVSSIAHFNGTIHFEDLKAEKWYSPMKAYRQSKLANLLFSYELQRKFEESGSDSISVAVHPGISSTNIIELPAWLEKLKELLLMSAEKGALSTIKGATDPGLKGGEFIGPAGIRQMFGYPAVLKSDKSSYNREVWQRLWKVSEEMTGIEYKI